MTPPMWRLQGRSSDGRAYIFIRQTGVRPEVRVKNVHEFWETA